MLEELQEAAGRHPTADELYQRLLAKGRKLSFGTVYRNLRILREQGLVLELEGGKEGSRFDATVSPHAHFRCLYCGETRDADMPVPEEAVAAMARQEGIQVMGYDLILYGRCHRCQNGHREGLDQ